MFRFYNSDAYPSSLNWKDSKATSFTGVVERYYRDHCYTHDADNCGDGTEFLAVRETGGETKYFLLSFSWYIDRNSEEYIINDHEITEVAKVDTKDLVEDRDWMKVSPHSYSKTKWPPIPETVKEIAHA
jgi:hypothetical protein